MSGRLSAEGGRNTRLPLVRFHDVRYRIYPRVLEELLPAVLHRTDLHANNRLETDHGRLKARLRPMRGLKRDRTASVIVAGHAFLQNLRRGFYDLGTDVGSATRLADAFAELAVAMSDHRPAGTTPSCASFDQCNSAAARVPDYLCVTFHHPVPRAGLPVLRCGCRLIHASISRVDQTRPAASVASGSGKSSYAATI